MAKVTELISDRIRTQTQAVSFQDLSLEPQSSPQTKVKAAVPTRRRKPNIYSNISGSNKSINKKESSSSTVYKGSRK